MKVTWSCPHTLASSSEKDSVVRMYNFETEDNYMLSLGQIHKHNESCQKQIVDLRMKKHSKTPLWFESYCVWNSSTPKKRQTMFLISVGMQFSILYLDLAVGF